MIHTFASVSGSGRGHLDLPQGFTSTRIYDDQGNPIESGRIVRNRERTR